MKHNKLIFVFCLMCGIGLADKLWAQCGASVSSCKNCHEVQGKLKVSSKGIWHQQHSFGDFCEFCHGGNVQSLEKIQAHQGMGYPLANIQASCASCHPGDLMVRAQKYAEVLKYDLMSPAAVAPAESKSKAPPAIQTVQSQQTTPSQSQSMNALPEFTGGEIIDFQTVAETEPETAVAINIGDWIIVFLIGLMAAVFLGLWYYFNRTQLQRKWIRFRERWRSTEIELPEVKVSSSSLDLEKLSQDPHRKQLLFYLQDCDAETVQALNRLLVHGKKAEELLVAVSKLDPQLLHSLRSLDDQQLRLLLALL